MAATHTHSVHTPMSSDESDLRISASKKRIVAQKRRCVAVKRQRRRSAPCKITTAKKLPELSDVTICNHVSQSSRRGSFLFSRRPRRYVRTLSASSAASKTCMCTAACRRRARVCAAWEGQARGWGGCPRQVSTTGGHLLGEPLGVVPHRLLAARSAIVAGSGRRRCR